MPSAETNVLQVVVLHYREGDETRPFETALFHGVLGTGEDSDYLPGGEPLKIAILPYRKAPPDRAPDEILGEALHTIVVLIAGRKPPRDSPELAQEHGTMLAWAESCWQRVDESEGRHLMLVVPVNDEIAGELQESGSRLADSQFVTMEDLGEKAIRPAILSLMVLHEARQLMADGMPPAFRDYGRRLFLSHAKRSGLPLALSLKRLIEEYPWLNRFYDAVNIRAGRNWRRELERGVSSSVLIALRTNGYDQRFWCRQEVQWADEYAVPMVCVEAWTQLALPPCDLPLGRAPSARVPDGNGLRILCLALRESVRALVFLRLFEHLQSQGRLPRTGDGNQVHALPFAPTDRSLIRICRRIAQAGAPAGGRSVIVYPDPPMPDDRLLSVQAIVEHYAPGTELLTPQTILTIERQG